MIKISVTNKGYITFRSLLLCLTCERPKISAIVKSMYESYDWWSDTSTMDCLQIVESIVSVFVGWTWFLLLTLLIAHCSYWLQWWQCHGYSILGGTLFWPLLITGDHGWLTVKLADRLKTDQYVLHLYF